MREVGEESVNLLSIFGQCIAARHSIPVKRLAMYNLYTRYLGHNFHDVIDPSKQTEITLINSMGSSDPTTVFLDNVWKTQNKPPVPEKLKMFRTDHADKESAAMLCRFRGLERFYLVGRPRKQDSKSTSTAATPTTPATSTPTPAGTGSTYNTPTITEQQCRSIAGEYLAMLQSHSFTMKHLLLKDHWTLSDDALLKLCQSMPHLEQLGVATAVPPLTSLRSVMKHVPNLWAIRMLITPGSEIAAHIESMDLEMHAFVLATEMWRPEYKNVRYVGLGDKLVCKLGRVIMPGKNTPSIPEGQENSLNAKRAGPMRQIEIVSRESVSWIEIWGLDSMKFDPSFP